jgi:hypothetical protein
MLSSNQNLSRSGKLLAWFSLINGLLTIATPLLLNLMFKQPLPPFIAVTFVILGAISVVAGYYCLGAKVWAFWLLFILFLIQIAEHFSPNFFFSFIGPLSLKFGWSSVSPPSRTNLNLLAIVVCFFAFKNARSLTHHSSGTPNGAP